jgi:hypothetical protein
VALSRMHAFLLKFLPCFGCYLLEEGCLSVMNLERAAFIAER